jgi:hypothetical protein
LLGVIETSLANIDPNLNFTTVTYGELVADWNTVYGDFITWYGTFFGPNGLIHLSVNTIEDGQTPVYRFDANVTELGLGIDVVDVERPNFFPIQFESIAEWISTKFGSVILANSCALCAAGGGVLPPPANNGTNGTNNSNGTVG